MTIALRYAARSDRGLVRGDNQDSVYAGPRLLAVADGIGGNVGGAVASRVVIDTIAPLDEDTPPPDLLSALRDATELANAHLRQVVEQEPQLDGMGTTLTAILFAGSRLGLCHVGDSRAYLLRDGTLEQITRDATFVQSLVDEGRITPEEASVHPQRSLILRALTGDRVDPDLRVREAFLGDRYLLCSDGLSDYVSLATIDETMRRPDPHEVADQLIELALRAGGPDNITCIVADVVEAQYAYDEPVIDGAAGMENGRGEPAVDGAPSSAAARAALASPEPEPVDDLPTGGSGAVGRSRRRLRRWLIPAAALILIAGGLVGLYAWSQRQYFVGQDGSKVAVYRGVNVSLAGLHLYHRAWTTDLALTDLATVARNRVSDGLGADGRAGARKIVSDLGRNEVLPPCPTAAPTPTTTATRARPTPRATHPSARTPVASRTSAGPSPSASPTPTPVPGKDCR